jgi:hypothetical protein
MGFWNRSVFGALCAGCMGCLGCGADPLTGTWNLQHTVTDVMSVDGGCQRAPGDRYDEALHVTHDAPNGQYTFQTDLGGYYVASAAPGSPARLEYDFSFSGHSFSNEMTLVFEGARVTGSGRFWRLNNAPGQPYSVCTTSTAIDGGR